MYAELGKPPHAVLNWDSKSELEGLQGDFVWWPVHVRVRTPFTLSPTHFSTQGGNALHLNVFLSLLQNSTLQSHSRDWKEDSVSLPGHPLEFPPVVLQLLFVTFFSIVQQYEFVWLILPPLSRLNHSKNAKLSIVFSI